MAKMMAATFAAAEVAQLKHGTSRRFNGSNTSTEELQKAIAAIFGQINFGTLPQGTMGAFGLTRQRAASPINGTNKPNGFTPD